MNFTPTVQFHESFQFAENTDTKKCCCWFQSRAAPREFVVDDRFVLHGRTQPVPYRERILANKRLGNLIRSRFDQDPIENDEAFEMVKKKINDNLQNGDPLTSEKIAKIINAIHEVKKELNSGKSHKQKN